MIKIESCPSCGANEFFIWDTGFLICNECDLVFRESFPSPMELRKIYETYYSELNIKKGNTNMVSNVVALRNQVRFIKKIASPGAKILDFGAGTGELASYLVKEGFKVDGCEFARDARATALNRYGLDFYPDLQDIERNKYDLIIGIEVIEHLTDPVSDIRNLKTFLRKQGLLYLTTPNRNGLVSRIRKSDWREAKKPFHLILFNFFSLHYMLDKSSFHNIRHIRFSPLTSDRKSKILFHRLLQVFGLYGGLRVTCEK